MLINIPEPAELDAVALRFFFDAWARSISLITDFAGNFDVDHNELLGECEEKALWIEYVAYAQSEISAVCALAQQSAELRLKSIICDANPVFLLLNAPVSFKGEGRRNIDFTQLRTLDAVDLPNAVKSLTEFNLQDSFINQYGELRRLRNVFTHLGAHKGELSPHKLIALLTKQYCALWPDGRWLYRRVRFDGNSARSFFHDERWSSSTSNVMLEMPYLTDLLDNQSFKKMVGVPKTKLVGYCPSCMSQRATKWDADGHPTAYRTGANSAKCGMCEHELKLRKSSKSCAICGSKFEVTDEYSESEYVDDLCFMCGQDVDP